MYRIAVIEDDTRESDSLRSLLSAYAAAHGVAFSADVYHDASSFLAVGKGVYDIVFMDINIMNDMNGIKAAHKLRQADSVVTLIFITSFEQFAVKGYEVEAFDFIVKPVSYPDFALRMNRVLKHVQKERQDTINIKNEGKFIIASVRDIKYVEVMRHKMLFHMTDGIVESTGTLREMEDALTDKYFVRCNKCYLVNLRHVRGMDGLFVNVDGELLLVSRPRKKDFLSALNRYLSK